ncbi:MAG TPA: nucleoside hydrolase [Oligoflexus sp.]|uniref:nucleoside hydrolase n=1 Tax=Oligoflexus sp. TaxID=1971216 RepID=UPI002D4B8E6A|nr:nucleoside hydrolase [Oligoflexus sp.]HYX31985.1 nucleoside hydrolase [Oligoflexus sp.]
MHLIRMLSLCLFCLGNLSQGAEAKTPVIIDTDMAIDDWLAMFYLLHHPSSRVLGVTVTGAGEAHCQPGAQHAVDLVDLTPQKGIPVACGPGEPMDGFHQFPAPWREGADTFYGVPLKASSRKPDPRSAPDVLIDLLERADAPVSLVILGNATNVALALGKAPQIKKKIERIAFMGGSIWAGGNIIVPNFTDKHKNKTAEWNILIDPIAARIVLESGIPVTLVPLDGTNHVKVTPADASAMKAAARTDGARFFSQILDKTKWFIDSGEYYFWDALTAAVILHPEFCTLKDLPLEVIVAYSEKTNGDPLPAFGKQRWDGKERRNFDPYFTGQTILSDRGAMTRVCVAADAKAFKKDLIHTINLRP